MSGAALQQAVEANTKAIQDLIAMMQKGQAGAGGAGGVAPGSIAPGEYMGAFAQPYWQKDQERETKAVESGGSIVRRVLSESGMGQAAGFLGSLTSMNPAGLLGAGTQFTMSAFEDSMRSERAFSRAARATLEDSAPGLSELAVTQRAVLAGKTAEARERADPGFLQQLFEAATLSNDQISDSRLDEAREVRRRRRLEAEPQAITDNLTRRGEDFFSAFAGAGGRPTRDQIRDVLEVFRPMAEAQFATNAEIQNIASQMIAEKPGVSARRAGR